MLESAKNKTMSRFIGPRKRPGGVAARDVVHTFLGAAGAAAPSAAKKRNLFIKKQYYFAEQYKFWQCRTK